MNFEVHLVGNPEIPTPPLVTGKPKTVRTLNDAKTRVFAFEPDSLFKLELTVEIPQPRRGDGDESTVFTFYKAISLPCLEFGAASLCCTTRI